MMDLEKLDWILYKQRDIVNQIVSIKRKIEEGKPIKNIGIPDGIDAQSLINFQKDRYHILDIAKNYDEERIKEWIRNVRKRVCKTHEDGKTECYRCYSAISEISLLEGCIKGWLKLPQK